MIQNRRFVTGKEMFRDVGNRKTVSSLLYKYSRRNSIVRIRRNVYLPTNPVDGFVDENKYEIGCNSVPGSYLSYHSAMEFYGLQNQSGTGYTCPRPNVSALLSSSSSNICMPRTGTGKGSCGRRNT